MAEILRGAPAAAALTSMLIPRCEALKTRGIIPTLAIVRVGARADDVVYESAVMNRCGKIGIEVKQFLLSMDCGTEALLDTIREINGDDSIHGCLVLRPLSGKAMERAVCDLLAPEKDVDGMTPRSLAGILTGSGAGFPPCTAEACIKLLEHYGIAPAGKHAVVLGRSLVIGTPVSMLLLEHNATVTVCHSRTTNAPELCRAADILIACAGKAELVDQSYLRPGQVVIDVGMHEKGAALCGDVRYSDASAIVGAITPVPGGVGSVTSSVLAEHLLAAAERYG